MSEAKTEGYFKWLLLKLLPSSSREKFHSRLNCKCSWIVINYLYASINHPCLLGCSSETFVQGLKTILNQTIYYIRLWDVYLIGSHRCLCGILSYNLHILGWWLCLHDILKCYFYINYAIFYSSTCYYKILKSFKNGLGGPNWWLCGTAKLDALSSFLQPIWGKERTTDACRLSSVLCTGTMECECLHPNIKII